jgi:tetratricopeptide (TPR) repeat protein
MGLAFIYERQSEFNNAIAIYEAILELNPELLVAKNNLASLMADHRQDQESLERARQLATEFRNSAIPQFRDTYAWASVMLGTNLEEAVVILEGIVKDNSEVDVYNFHLGEAYRRKGDSENAMVYLSKAIELSAPGSDVAERANSSLQQLK